MMKIDIIVKALIVNGMISFPLATYAWTVSERVVELPKELESNQQIVDPTILYELADRDRVTSTRLPNRLSKAMDAPIFERTQAKLTDDEQAASDYQRVEQHLNNGETVQAQKLLTSILYQSPNHHASRAELANLYLKQDQLEAAEEILAEGLRIDENNSDFLRLMAVVHDRKEEPDKALSLLVKVKDSRKQDKDYIALLGHIYQETGHYGLARQQYFRLLQMEPKNPMWLLGVSIALDSEGQRDAALEGYYRLIKEGMVDSSVITYVQNRIKILKG